MSAKKIMGLVQALSELEKSVPTLERVRIQSLDALRDGSPGEVSEGLRTLEHMLSERREMRDALELLELALKNSAATFARFDQKAAKDAQTLAEAKKRLEAPAFNDKDPILLAQRQAYMRAAQKLDFLVTELDKLRGVLDNKYQATRDVPELKALQKALETDREGFMNETNIKMSQRLLVEAARSHHLDG